MGRTVTPKYRVEFRDEQGRNGGFTAAAWRGKVSQKALAVYVETLNASFEPGGSNEHVRASFPGAKVAAARIVRQSDDVVLATWEPRA